ncbi:NADH:quinone oxidoreductase [Roseinatronobacter sp.]|uniref:NADH:quinone oxidoreductase n=1 Tax=Roseinatronobacter sp. TaxID=1945755 RepID=UPI0025D2BFA7|nr:NADH:quinone oxidoreductase [Roseibaca sp.]
MAHSEFKEAPPLHGWAIAVGAGALMFGVSLVVIGIDGNGSVAIGAVVALVVALIFTVAERAPKTAVGAQNVAEPAATPAPVAERSAAPEANLAPKAAAAPETTEAASAAPAAEKPASTPAAAPKAAVAEPATTETASPEASKPAGLDAPMGEKDDLKRISGVGPVLEGKLNGLGFYHFWQISRWTRAEVDWVDGYLSFKGRIDRDNWISQATKLAEDSPSKPPA